MANIYTAQERDRIRAALIAYMKDRRLGTPRMQELTHVPHRTLHRYIKGDWTNDGSVQLIEKFLGNIMAKETAIDDLGTTLHRFFQYKADIIAGVYRVSSADAPLSELTIKFATAANTHYAATERTTGKLLRVYEGSLVFTQKSLLAILKDRLMRTARVHMLHLNSQSKTFFGLVYDDGPIARGGMPYQMVQTTLERIGHAE